jgi:hypothetical protein
MHPALNYRLQPIVRRDQCPGRQPKGAALTVIPAAILYDMRYKVKYHPNKLD